jgi:hypothetical protein
MKQIIKDSESVPQSLLYQLNNGRVDFSEEEWLDLLKIQGSLIQYISNPTEKQQLAAVNQNPYSIVHILAPSEEAQIAAITKDIMSIKNIKNPTPLVVELFRHERFHAILLLNELKNYEI